MPDMSQMMKGMGGGNPMGGLGSMFGRRQHSESLKMNKAQRFAEARRSKQNKKSA